MTYISSWELMGIEKGQKEKALQSLLTVLRLRFGDIPSKIHQLLEKAETEKLDAWLAAGVTAESLDDVFA